MPTDGRWPGQLCGRAGTAGRCWELGERQEVRRDGRQDNKETWERQQRAMGWGTATHLTIPPSPSQEQDNTQEYENNSAFSYQCLATHLTRTSSSSEGRS